MPVSSDTQMGVFVRILRRVVSEPQPASVHRANGITVDRARSNQTGLEVLSPGQNRVVAGVPSEPKETRPIQGLRIRVPHVFGVIFRQSAGTRRESQREGQQRKHEVTPRPTRSEVEELLRSLFPLLLPPAIPGTRSFGGLDLPHDLYEFQAEGVRFLLQARPGALLADDMGLGKTVQAIVALRLMIRLGQVSRALIVVPKSVVASWQHHFGDWAPEIASLPIQGDAWERRRAWSMLQRREIDVGIITYESLRNDAKDKGDGTAKIPDLDLVVADEVQRIKNPSTQIHQVMRSLKCDRRWGLTGTPLENKIEEPASLLRYLDPSVPAKVTSAGQMRRLLSGRMLRRLKSQVLDELPDLFSHPEHLQLTVRQQKEYQRAEREGVVELAGKPRNITNVLTLVTRLKQICNDVNGHSAKLEWLSDYVEEAVDEGDKILVFSQYVEALDQIERRLVAFGPLKYYGGLSGKRREAALKAFEEPQHHVMVLQTRSGGVGLNLQAANHVVHFDSWWNPAVESQATARAHRLGQRKTVFERTLVSVDTIEERIQVLLDEKRELFREVVDDLSVEGLKAKIGVDEMYALFDIDPDQT